MLNDDTECNKAVFHFCKIQYFLGNIEETIHYINNKLNKEISNASRLYYNMYLIILYRSINKYDEMKEIVIAIDKDINLYKTLKIYGYYLRMSEVYKSRIDAIPDVELSVKFFEKYPDMKLQVAKAQISLSFLYAISGKLNNAKSLIETAMPIFKGNYKYITFNNLSAIELLKNNFSIDTYNSLQEARFYASGLFSRLVIHNNLMIWLYENNNKDELVNEINIVDKLLQDEKDKHLVAIISYNLSVFLQNINIIASEKYYNIAYVYKSHCSTLKKRLTNQKPENDVDKFLLSKKWHIAMLSFWEMDFIEDY